MSEREGAPQPTPPTADARLKAIGLMCLAVALFAVLDASAKWLVTHTGLPALQVVWMRYASNAVLLLIFVNPWTVPGLFRSKKPGLQVLRAVLLLGSTFLNFLALRYLQLTETTSIMFATPFFVALIAGFWLGQWIGPRQWAAIIVGFLGVLIITRPGLGGLHWAAALSITGAVCYAVYNLVTRVLAAHDPTMTTLAFSSLGGAILLAPAIPSVWIAPPTLLDWALLISTGLWGLLGHWCLIHAHRTMTAQDLSPYMYTQIVWMAVIGWLVFAEIPIATTVIGAAIVIGSGLYLLWLERRRPPA